MEELRDWALMLVFLALSGFIYYYLLPSGRVSETAKNVFSLLTVAAVCVPLFGLFGASEELLSGFGVDTPGESYAPAEVYAEIARDTIEEKLSLIIKKHTGEPFFIETEIHISDGMCIDIKQVTILFGKYPDGLPELSLDIEAALGITPHFALKENEDDPKNTVGKIQNR